MLRSTTTMRTLAIFPCLAAALFGCASTTSYVHSDTTLGRVVVYRNGVAYFERSARIEGDSLQISVPADKVDDFLKSLTVVDAKTGDPAPIAYPTSTQNPETGLMDMKISLSGPSPHDLRLSYVTEAPSWKPSYRVTLEKDGKVNVQAWAIVDNTSGEDWKNVELGVGSSSALSFRFDLRSVRLVQRETLRSDDLFAQAPPMGGAAYGQQPGAPQTPGQQRPAQQGPRVLGDLSDQALALKTTPGAAAETIVVSGKAPVIDLESSRRNAPAKKPSVNFRAPTVGGGGGAGTFGRAHEEPPADNSRFDVSNQERKAEVGQIDALTRQLKGSNAPVIVEGYADANDGDKFAASLDRANRARDQLIRGGIDPARVVAVGNGEKAGRAGGVRILEAPSPPAGGLGDAAQKADAPGAQATEPIGTSHFDSRSRMTVARGTSAMVSILGKDTEGSVVYYYDPESPRGNTSFPFRAVRIKNPTDSVLESGPVTVFGEGRFIGEGLADPIPASSVAFVPFALDRQVVVERKEEGKDQIARIITVQRGVFSTEVEHTKRYVLTINNRLGEPATVYVRHTVEKGYKLAKGPADRERIGGAYLFRAVAPANGKVEVVIEESTPVFKTADIRAPEGMDLIQTFVSAGAEGKLKTKVAELLKLHKEMVDTEQRIATMRDQMSEYRSRMDELHAQVVTLRAVKTAGPLITNLEKKLSEMSDKLSKSTLDLVAEQEKLMVAKIRFQDGVAELSLEKQ